MISSISNSPPSKFVAYIASVALPFVPALLLSGLDEGFYTPVPLLIQVLVLDKINNATWRDFFATAGIAVIASAFMGLQEFVTFNSTVGCIGYKSPSFSDLIFGQLAITILLWEGYFLLVKRVSDDPVPSPPVHDLCPHFRKPR